MIALAIFVIYILIVRVDSCIFVNKIGIKFIYVPDGEFLMGNVDETDEHNEVERLHRVRLTKGFYIGTTEVSQAQWKAVMGEDKNPSEFKGDDLPVEMISWNDAVEFCKKLSEKEGKNYRLPTEAEWEYACRATTKTPFYTGKTITTDDANYNGKYKYGENGRVGKYRKKTTPVGSFKPNKWGLYDMHGNVAEWCGDYYAPYQIKDGVDINPIGPMTGSQRVIRGGFWMGNPWFGRSSCRNKMSPDARADVAGLRIVFEK